MKRKINYVEKDMLGGWQIEVRGDRGILGNIRRHPLTKEYQFYEGPNNILTPSYKNTDLDELKDRIEEVF